MGNISFERSEGNLGRFPTSTDSNTGLVVIADSTLSDLGVEPIDFVATSYQQAYEIWNNQGTWHNAQIDQGFLFHVQEFFRINPNGRIYVRLAAVNSYNAIPPLFMEMQRLYNGEIRQFGVLVKGGETTTIKNELDNTLAATLSNAYRQLYQNNAPAPIICAPPLANIGAPDELPDVRAFNQEGVSFVIGGGSSAVPFDDELDVFDTNACLGTLLGVVSLAKVSENIGWIAKFDVLGGAMDLPVMITQGTAYQLNMQTEQVLQQLTDYGYIYPRKYFGVSGIYFNDDPVCVPATSDYAYLSNVRTICKAERLLYLALLPKLNSPLRVLPNGNLRPVTIADFKASSDNALLSMQNNDELSSFSTFIDPTQNVLATSLVVVNYELQPVGVARKIKGKIALVPRILNNNG